MSLQSNLINIVLVDTIHPGNIGSVARAMKTMGLSRLSLVNPRVFPSGDANALSGNATDVLENAQIYTSIKEAIKDSTFVYATSSEIDQFNGLSQMLFQQRKIFKMRQAIIKKSQ